MRFGLVVIGVLLVLATTDYYRERGQLRCSATIVRVVRTSAGPVLGTASGRTLYVFVDDLLTRAPSACTATAPTTGYRCQRAAIQGRRRRERTSGLHHAERW